MVFHGKVVWTLSMWENSFKLKSEDSCFTCVLTKCVVILQYACQVDQTTHSKSTLCIPIFSAYSVSLGSGLGCLQIHSYLQERQKDMWNILSERSTIIIPTKLNYVFYQHRSFTLAAITCKRPNKCNSDDQC